ncbi:hypothetical protein BH09MYX1_BH09MYX1_30330 [soil metagenome]
MVSVKVTVAMGRKTVSLDQVSDVRIKRGLEAAAKNVGAALEGLKCPEHGKGPTDVRIHFDSTGTGDLKYHSCCEKLGSLIKAKLG